MRWAASKFALFAAIAAAFGTFAAPAPAHATTATTTLMDWRRQNSNQFSPSGPTSFYVRVTARSGSARPKGKVTVTWNGNAQAPVNLKDDDAQHPTASITEHDLQFDLRDSGGRDVPHYFTAKYTPDDADAFSTSSNDLGIAIGGLTADPEPSKEGQTVTYTFMLAISPASGRRPSGHVAFSDDQNHSSDPPHRPLTDVDSTHLKATWTVAQGPSRPHTTAIFAPDDDVYLPVKAERDHNVTAAPPPPPGANTGTTQRPTTGTTKPTVPKGNTPTTGALAPISPSSTAVTSRDDSSTTAETFGEFPTTPSDGGTPSALGAKEKRDGPPLAVVVMTLGALGILGAIGGIRRYRKPSEWF
jgi:hypothetical protein